VTVALPFLDAMVPAMTAAAKPVRRLGFVYAPDGMAITSSVNYWKPTGTGSGLELSPILQPLEAFRDRMVVVSGLSHKQAEAMGDAMAITPAAPQPG